MNDNDEWESLAGNEGLRILRADALNCAALQKF